jgi:hypothetical protein
MHVPRRPGCDLFCALRVSPSHGCRCSANASRRISSASGRSSSRGRSDAPVELQQIRDGLEEELRLLKRQYNEIASHLSQVSMIHGTASASLFSFFSIIF